MEHYVELQPERSPYLHWPTTGIGVALALIMDPAPALGDIVTVSRDGVGHRYLVIDSYEVLQGTRVYLSPVENQ